MTSRLPASVTARGPAPIGMRDTYIQVETVFERVKYSCSKSIHIQKDTYSEIIHSKKIHIRNDTYCASRIHIQEGYVFKKDSYLDRKHI